MDEKNGTNLPEDKNTTPTPEIPPNAPPSDIKPVKSKAKPKQSNTLKIAYAFAILLAFGGALAAKLVTESNLGTIDVPIESDYVTISESTAVEITEEPEFEVRQNLTDIPDTRPTETEEETTEETTLKAENTTKATEMQEDESLYAVPYRDYFALPVGTEILKDYSPSTPSYNEITGDWRTHGAIDFKAQEGDQVKAIAYGKVTKVYDDALYGTTIEIDHGNEVVAKYCGFNKDTLEVKKGDTVKNAQLLGYLGEIPCEKNSTAHLHFEVYYKGENVDPLTLMSK